MNSKPCVRLRLYDESESHTAYIELRDHPHELVGGIVAKTVALDHLVDYTDGPIIKVDFDKEGRPIGIEILYSAFDGSEEE